MKCRAILKSGKTKDYHVKIMQKMEHNTVEFTHHYKFLLFPRFLLSPSESQLFPLSPSKFPLFPNEFPLFPIFQLFLKPQKHSIKIIQSNNLLEKLTVYLLLQYRKLILLCFTANRPIRHLVKEYTRR